MAFQALNGLSPPYLDQLVRVADPPGRHRLRSSLSHRLQVPAYRLATVGRRSFPFAASILWNSLPPDIVICLPVRLLPQTKDVLVPAIISRHFAVTVHISTSLSYILQWHLLFYILATLKLWFDLIWQHFFRKISRGYAYVANCWISKWCTQWLKWQWGAGGGGLRWKRFCTFLNTTGHFWWSNKPFFSAPTTLFILTIRNITVMLLMSDDVLKL